MAPPPPSHCLPPLPATCHPHPNPAIYLFPPLLGPLQSLRGRVSLAPLSPSAPVQAPPTAPAGECLHGGRRVVPEGLAMSPPSAGFRPLPGPLAAAPATPPAQPSCLLPPQGSLLPPAPHNLSWACSGLWKSLRHTLLLPSCWHLPEGLGPQGLRLRQDHLDSFPCRWPPYPAQAGPPQSTPGSGQVSGNVAGPH